MENLPKHNDFKESFVAFVDILGFDRRVRGIKKNGCGFDKVAQLLFSIKKTADNLSNGDNPLEDFQLTAISDSLIVSVPADNDVALSGILNILHKVQYDLIATPFRALLRGYITQGPVYHKDGLIFGKGYSDAYKGETSIIGSAPRIVLSPDLVKTAKEKADSYSGPEKMEAAIDLLTEDKSDGFYYIDYLNPELNKKFVNRESQLQSERQAISCFIKSSLQKHETDLKVLPKYKWLENYFKMSC